MSICNYLYLIENNINSYNLIFKTKKYEDI
jgi:hypothetical protein